MKGGGGGGEGRVETINKKKTYTSIPPPFSLTWQCVVGPRAPGGAPSAYFPAGSVTHAPPTMPASTMYRSAYSTCDSYVRKERAPHPSTGRPASQMARAAGTSPGAASSTRMKGRGGPGW